MVNSALNGSLTAALNAANGVARTSGANGGLFAFGNNATWGNAANNLQVNFGGTAQPSPGTERVPHSSRRRRC